MTGSWGLSATASDLPYRTTNGWGFQPVTSPRPPICSPPLIYTAKGSAVGRCLCSTNSTITRRIISRISAIRRTAHGVMKRKLQTRTRGCGSSGTAWRDALLTALFASRREDQDALEIVRMLPKPSVLRLDRPPTGSAGPIIDAVTSAQTPGQVVIENSDATWPALRRRIAADFEHSGQVLPQQLKLVLQGLRSLPRLTVGAYERAGGMDGLEENVGARCDRGSHAAFAAHSTADPPTNSCPARRRRSASGRARPSRAPPGNWPIRPSTRHPSPRRSPCWQIAKSSNVPATPAKRRRPGSLITTIWLARSYAWEPRGTGRPCATLPRQGSCCS